MPKLQWSFALVIATALTGSAPADSFDVIIRHGTVIDGTGAPRYQADVAIAGGRIARIGNLAADRATTEIEARGLVVAPGFLNVHSHASPTGLPTAVNMLTQGVTTELLNADGGGPIDVTGQLEQLERGGLAVNIGASIGFNSVWSAVVGPTNRRPTEAEIEKMRGLVLAGLEHGATGVSAGLDYKPAYFATTDEVVRVLEPTARWRTFFPNHDRSTPENGFSSRAGLSETITIGERAGLVPEITHMKIQGHEQGTAAAVIEMLEEHNRAGHWVAADVYPYLAGQTSLAALIVPGWAQDGGLDSLRRRLKDPELRAKIIAESDQAIAARFNGPESIMVTGTRRLSDLMKEFGVPTAGAAVARVLDTESPWAILGFGIEPDLIRIMQYPSAAIACDCGAANGTRGHPRYLGTFPRVLGHYVRELHALTLEDAVRKMSGLPAALMGLADRGLLAPGMAADVTVFDAATVIDHSTFEKPDAEPEGIRYVLVNGVVALENGRATGKRGGGVLRRSAHEPSRRLALESPRELISSGAVDGGGAIREAAIEIRQAPGARVATGRIRLTGGDPFEPIELGVLQTTAGWASLTGRARTRAAAPQSFTLVVEAADPFADGHPATAFLTIGTSQPIALKLRGTPTIK